MTVRKKSETKVKKRKKKQFSYVLKDGRGRVYVRATYNNTVVSLTDQQGNVMAWGSAGRAGFSGPKKSTPFAAQKLVQDLADKAKAKGLIGADAFLKGPGSGRDAVIRALNANGIQVISIKDVTPVPHNGVRPRKRRRV
jgi:small subunit ribosomal protein S11